MGHLLLTRRKLCSLLDGSQGGGTSMVLASFLKTDCGERGRQRQGEELHGCSAVRIGTAPNNDQRAPSAAGPCWVEEAPAAARMWMRQGRHSLSQQVGGTERSRFSVRNVGSQVLLLSFSFPWLYSILWGLCQPLCSPAEHQAQLSGLWDPRVPRVQCAVRGKCGMVAGGQEERSRRRRVSP